MCEMSSTWVKVFIDGLGMEFVIFAIVSNFCNCSNSRPALSPVARPRQRIACLSLGRTLQRGQE
jgi:hypothetical protein